MGLQLLAQLNPCSQAGTAAAALSMAAGCTRVVQGPCQNQRHEVVVWALKTAVESVASEPQIINLGCLPIAPGFLCNLLLDRIVRIVLRLLGSSSLHAVRCQLRKQCFSVMRSMTGKSKSGSLVISCT